MIYIYMSAQVYWDSKRSYILLLLCLHNILLLLLYNIISYYYDKPRPRPSARVLRGTRRSAACVWGLRWKKRKKTFPANNGTISIIIIIIWQSHEHRVSAAETGNTAACVYVYIIIILMPWRRRRIIYTFTYIIIRYNIICVECGRCVCTPRKKVRNEALGAAYRLYGLQMI